MQEFVISLLFTAFASLATGDEFHCVGTCYSGRLFPLPEDIVYGKHLKGYSYRNITTDDAKKCYSSCVNDCRCKACQTKDARCELLDEDHTSKPSDFVAALGYVYYDLKQGFYKGKSHMVKPGVCHNGCCRSQYCLNGGTCIELCGTPKEKFYCKCPQPFVGKRCEKEARSCLDYLKDAPAGTTPPDGIYKVRVSTFTRKASCDFVSPNKAWVLIESFSLQNNKYFKKKAFHQTFLRKYLSPNWKDYRPGKSFYTAMHKRSTMFRATCDFPNRGGVLTPDYLFGYLSDYDIINHGDVLNDCFKFAHLNVRGYDYFNVSLTVWQKKETYHLHITATDTGCGFTGVPGLVSGENCFGWYRNTNPLSHCTATPQSTTQWWLGAEI